MKKLLFSLIAFVATAAVQAADKVESITSPDGKLKVEVTFGSELTFSVYDGSTVLLKDSRIGMTVKDGPKVGVNPVLKKKVTATINEQITAPFYRQTTVENNCNEMTFKMADGFSVSFRAYNSGVAYRFSAEKKGWLNTSSRRTTRLGFPTSMSMAMALTPCRLRMCISISS